MSKEIPPDTVSCSNYACTFSISLSAYLANAAYNASRTNLNCPICQKGAIEVNGGSSPADIKKIYQKDI